MSRSFRVLASLALLLAAVVSAVPAPGQENAPEAAAPAVEVAPAAEEKPQSKYAGVVFVGELENRFKSFDKGMRTLQHLLEDPMVGDFSFERVELESTDIDAALVKTRTALTVEEQPAAVTFLYLAARPETADDFGKAILDSMPGEAAVLIVDRTTAGGEEDKPVVSLTASASGGRATALFVFDGPTSENGSPLGMLLLALRGGADANRDRRITLSELAAALRGESGDLPQADFGDKADIALLGFKTPSEMAEALGADEALSLAGQYEAKRRWIEALLVLREIKKEKVTDPEYRRISETAQLNLALEARYSDSLRKENVERDVKGGLDLIGDVLMLANLHYVTDVDNRDLFSGGARNLVLFLENRELQDELEIAADPEDVSELSTFVRQSIDHIYEKETLTESDYLMRIKRVMMENEATAGIPSGIIVSEFLYGITAALDPHTDFIPRRAYKEFQDDTVGHFGGLGIEITLEDKILTVITPLDGTPAAEAGLLPGDRIIAIEGDSTEGMELMEAVLRLRGLVGTMVTITIIHRGDSTPIDVTIKRADILLESIKGYAVNSESGKWEYMLDEVEKIGYVRMTDFKESTPDDLQKVVSRLIDEGMKGLVLDLRFNHGGLLNSGVKISDLFIRDGVIVSVRGAHSRPVTFQARYFKTFKDFPFVVLVNEQTASAAEILAGALKDHHRATLVGSPTFGKGTVQTIYELERGRSALKLTTAKYYTPSGISLHREVYSEEGGLVPDVEVALDDDSTARLAEVWHLRGLKEEARERLIEMQSKIAESNPNYKVVDPDTFEDAQLDKAVELLLDEIKGTPGRSLADSATDDVS